MLALCYFVAAKASLLFAIPPGYATAVWPPSGIALAALLLWGTRAWPGVWLGAALTNFSVDLSIPAALGIATGNTLECVCAAWLAVRLTDRNAEFTQPEKVFLFAAVAALASVVAATVGVSSLHFAGAVDESQYLANWYTWWQGDATGILLVTPCILAWAHGERRAESRAGSIELAVFGTLLILVLLAVFVHSPEAYNTEALAFLVIPFFVWAACRFGERAVTLTVLIANGWAIWCTVNGLGPFQSPSLNHALLMLQAFTSTGALVALVLWALLRQRADAHRLLEDEIEVYKADVGRAAQIRDGAAAPLLDLLRSHAEQFEEQTGVAVEVVGDKWSASVLDRRTVRVLSWIAQEALHNVATHARARRVKMEFDYDAGLATLTIRDDGTGFTPDWQAKPGDGLMLMRERAEAAGGRLRVESAPGSGTTLRVSARG
jgi:integral membrane sensor domain MASE1